MNLAAAPAYIKKPPPDFHHHRRTTHKSNKKESKHRPTADRRLINQEACRARA
jgi:hypothetical protein